jgi:hypothetical protein
MKPNTLNVPFIAVVLIAASIASAQPSRESEILLKNWPAPLYYQPNIEEANAAAKPGLSREAQAPVGSLVFVAMTPCRVVDTRLTQGFPAPFGSTGPLVGGASPTNGVGRYPFYLSSTSSSHQCPIPNYALAYSLNITVVPSGPLGFLSVAPSPITLPARSSTLNDPIGTVLANAAIVPAGSPNGSIDIYVSDTTQVIIDINGFYAPQTGITLAPGTAANPSLSFAGDSGTGIFSSGAGAVDIAVSGFNVIRARPDGDLDLGGNIRKGGELLLHTGTNSTIGVGLSALNASSTAIENTATGALALGANTTGEDNTANGFWALRDNTTGRDNTASGSRSLLKNTIGSRNTAFGTGTLEFNTEGVYNTAVGLGALANNTTGTANIALGGGAGTSITTESNNILIGDRGTAGDSGVIRIGFYGVHQRTYVQGIRAVTTGLPGATVLVDANGQLGTISSSRRFKDDIQDMADASSRLLRLRPVTFRYHRPYADGSKPIDYGLIAEEVAEVYPDLVVHDADGRIDGVQYQKLAPMLLNEVQTLYSRLQAADQELADDRERHNKLEYRLAALEAAFAKSAPNR